MAIDIAAASHAVNELNGCLGVISKYVARLKADPDKAAMDLAEALEEIEKSCRVLDDAVKKYLILGYQSDALDKNSDALLDISGGKLSIAVSKGLGSCHKMMNIYQNTLHRWFERVFKKDDKALKDMETVFERLRHGDVDMFDLMRLTADQIQNSADETLKLVGAGKRDEARAQVQESFSDLNELRKRTNELMAKLYDLRAKFIEIAGL